jgi:hypothetical protein
LELAKQLGLKKSDKGVAHHPVAWAPVGEVAGEVQVQEAVGLPAEVVSPGVVEVLVAVGVVGGGEPIQIVCLQNLFFLHAPLFLV